MTFTFSRKHSLRLIYINMGESPYFNWDDIHKYTKYVEEIETKYLLISLFWGINFLVELFPYYFVSKQYCGIHLFTHEVVSLLYGKQTEYLYFDLNILILVICFRLLSSLFHSLAPCIFIADPAISVVWPAILIKFFPFLVFLLWVLTRVSK